ncbi:GNAT family N-acetyltransferase [Metabacillus litoralis]|uniref:GNAT family N-acetyltransferase n=1 Tax=Metabacillus litoralis TaxID=152268 RepID=A0A5C6VLY9_9BACI|nr:GNAT family protein [Metabacillus litoralis]TXC86030.1 GNAT family N-acetyltransferase [Metabacillus litoralis]
MLNIRVASLEDAIEIAFLKNHIVASTDFYLRTKDEPKEKADDYRKKMMKKQESGGLTIVAEYEGQVVGFLSFSRPTFAKVNHTGSFGMGVNQEFCHMGIGSELLAYLISWASHQKGLEKICLEVFSHNEIGIALYKKFGFKIEGKQIKQVKITNNQYADLVYMSLFL